MRYSHCLVLLFFAVLVAVQTCSVADDAKFVVPKNVVTLGSVKFGAGVKEVSFKATNIPVLRATTFRVKISNTGSKDLTFGKMEVGCSCLAATPTTKSIPQGEGTDIYIVFRPTTTGEATRVTTVNFGAGDRLVIRMNCEIKGLFEVSPEVIDVQRNAAISTVKVKANFPDIAKVTDVFLNESSLVDARNAVVDSDDASLDIDTQAFLDAKVARLPLQIGIKSDGLEQFALHRILLRRSDMLTVNPTVLVARWKAKDEKTATCFVSGNSEILKEVFADSIRCETKEVSTIKLTVANVRRVSDKMGRLTLVVTVPNDYPDSIDIVFKVHSTDQVVGQGTVLLR